MTPEQKPAFALEFYAAQDGTKPVLDWLRSLEDAKRRAIGVALYEVLQHMGIAVCGTEFGKNLGHGIFEFRVRHTAAEVLGRREQARPRDLDAVGADILLRVYCHAYGDKVILLLAAYDKGKSPGRKRENREIELAKSRLADFRRTRRR